MMLADFLHSFCTDAGFRRAATERPDDHVARLPDAERAAALAIVERFGRLRRELERRMRFPLAVTVEEYLVSRR